MSMDDQKISLLFLLDLSGAFDTIDQLCLLQTMKTHFWINGKVLGLNLTWLIENRQLKWMILNQMCSRYPSVSLKGHV